MRPSWDIYFLDIAAKAATRSTCDRLHVGCVLVRERAIVSSGYNGSGRGLPHCDDAGHDMVAGHCVRTAHAEANAVAQAAREGSRTAGCTAYITAIPCWPCFRLLLNAGIARVVYGNATSYNLDERVVVASAVLGLPVALGAQDDPPSSKG